MAKTFLYKKMGLLEFEVSWEKTFEDGGRTYVQKNISPTLTRRLFAVVCRRRRRRRFAVNCSPAYDRQPF